MPLIGPCSKLSGQNSKTPQRPNYVSSRSHNAGMTLLTCLANASIQQSSTVYPIVYPFRP